MKTFTITLPNKKTDSEGVYKNYLLKRLLLSYPELTIDGIDSEETENSYQYLGPNSRIMFGANYYSKCDIAKYKACKYCPFYNEPKNYDIATNFELAMKKLDEYSKQKYGYKKLYDFVLEDGTPVKEYQNFIQVGRTIIPKNNIRYTLNNLREKERIVINNFIVMINNTEYNF